MTEERYQFQFKDGAFVDTFHKYDPEAPTKELVLIDRLSICGCGSPDIVTNAFVDVMRRFESKGASPLAPIVNSVLDYLILCLLDAIEFADHGTSVYSCWLTDAGKAFLELDD